jgi:ABC-2 type transport system ATP-binding protein
MLGTVATIDIRGLSHAYGGRSALVDFDLSVARGELLAVLGPNGSGKTTLFRVLATLVPVQSGAAAIGGCDLARQTAAVRRQIGVVFQAPSLDRKLTVVENLRIQAALYGLVGSELARRIDELLSRFGLSERAGELTERLSGGLRRRVELAKGLLHGPAVLLLDEPSTGLDPAARSELWRYLQELRRTDGTTILLTTHFLDEAEDADRIAILNEGRLVALGSPVELKATVAGDAITVETAEPAALAAEITAALAVPARVVEGAVRLEVPSGHHWIPKIVEAFPGRVRAIRLGQPSLEDVFIDRTGKRF